MTKKSYKEHKFTDKSLQLIHECNTIIAAYQAQGYILTLRQLYYQCVVRNLFPNTERSYKNLGGLINDGRLAGLVDWEAIEDRGRNLRSLSHWASPVDIIESARRSFRIDKWAYQKYRPEVWVEKEGLLGVIERACNDLDVPYFACKGYNSQSEQWRAGQRFIRYARSGQKPIVLHLGDHDSSGLDMTRDNRDRLEMFSEGVQVERLALNYNQVLQYNPAPNPAKETDSRFAGYSAEFGYESWELDALEPSVIVEIVRSAILSVRNERAWREAVAEESGYLETLEAVESRWDDVKFFLDNDNGIEEEEEE